MSPQRSNRAELIEGTLRCLEQLPLSRITTRSIAEESGANQASITYHFRSKEALITEAIVTGLDRWLGEVEASLAGAGHLQPGDRFRLATRAVQAGRRRHRTLFDNFLVAVTRARHDDVVQVTLSEGIKRTRAAIAGLLDLGGDRTGQDTAALVLSMFYGLSLQEAVEPRLGVSGARMEAAQVRLREMLPPPVPN